MAGLLDIYAPVQPPADREVTAGGKVDVGEAFSAAFENQAQNWSMLGAQSQLRNQIEDVGRKYGIELPGEYVLGPDTNGARRRNIYDEFWSYAKGDGELFSDEAKGFRDALVEANKKDPSVPTFDGIVASTRKHAKDLDLRAQKAGARSRGLVEAGAGFAGGMFGSFTLNDPINLATLGVGGGGKSLATRILTEMGANAGVEAVNQFTGVATTRGRLGLDLSLNDQLMNVAFAGVGAGVIRGGAEAVGAGWRSIFKRPSARAAAHLVDDAARVEKANPFTAPEVAPNRYEIAANERLMAASVEASRASTPEATVFGTVPVAAELDVKGAPRLAANGPEVDRIVQQIAPELQRAIAAVDQKIATLRSEMPLPDAQPNRAVAADVEAVSARVAELEPKLAKLEAQRGALLETDARMRETISKSVNVRQPEFAPEEAIAAAETTSRVAETMPERVEIEFDGLAKLADPETAPKPAEGEAPEPFSIEGIGEVDLDMPIVLEPGVAPKTLRAILASSKGDDDLVNAMKVCLL